MVQTDPMSWSFLKAMRSGEYRISRTTWVVAIVSVIYAISPIDIIPELILGPLGFADDLGLVAIAVTLFTRERQRWLAGIGPQ